MVKILVAILLLVLCSGCAARWSLVKEERIGVVLVETWKNHQTKTCERRAYMYGVVFLGPVECPVTQ